MQVKKIVVNNLMVPGAQTYDFDALGGLVGGAFYSLNELPIIQELLNGGWLKNTSSFEKYYPKFAKLQNNMNLDLDALIVFEPEELEQLNKVVTQNGYKPQKSHIWFYSIKCFYPFIFPVVTLKPAEDMNDDIIALGNHYDKFIKSNNPKRDLLTAIGVNAVGLFREKYFEYKRMPVKPAEKQLHDEYLRLLKSIFRNDDYFVTKIGNLIYQLDDGDVIHYGDQFDFYYKHPLIVEWLDSVALLKLSPEIRYDFMVLMFEHYFNYLQFAYSLKSFNDNIEIRHFMLENNASKAIDFRLVQPLLRVQLSDKPLQEQEMNKAVKKAGKIKVNQDEEHSNAFETDDDEILKLLNGFKNLKSENIDLQEEISGKKIKRDETEVKLTPSIKQEDPKSVAQATKDLKKQNKLVKKEQALKAKAEKKRIKDAAKLAKQQEAELAKEIIEENNKHIIDPDKDDKDLPKI